KRSLNVSNRVTQNHRSAVWAGHRTVSFGELGEQPFHLVLIERHVDLDGGMAGDGGSDASANLLQVERLILAGKLIEQFMQQVLDLGSFNSGGRELDRDTSRTKRLGVEAIVVQFLRKLGEDRLLGRGELDHDWHQ